MITHLIGSLVLLTALVTSSRASIFDAEFLQQLCTASESKGSAPKAMLDTCNGYLTAVYDRVDRQQKVCVTNSISVELFRDIFVNHFNVHPEDGHRSAEAVVEEAYVKAFPCK